MTSMRHTVYSTRVMRGPITAARVERLLDVLASEACRREFETLGYDRSNTGNQVAQVRAP